MIVGPRAITSPTPFSSGLAMRISSPGNGQPTLPAGFCIPPSDRQDRRRFGEAVAFVDREAETAEVFDDLRLQRGAAADEVAHAPAERVVHRPEDPTAEVPP